ncbi:hypothetical protein DQ04_10281020 [Trypanosoma grayi]|uniref:hypothetical protein n=1 Tax=Trypanosoma grayi TaxID=71804 RepID=UPI0004F41922|nr:hypothetical protein DQ04_10281020 [Trypanosoma grayi]KEG07293.1 hypothetical protein DQ04_10281020 [Trypanosoma grayi]
MLAVRHVLFVVALLLLCGIVPAVGAPTSNMDEVMNALETVKQAADTAEATVREAYEKAEDAKKKSEAALDAAMTVESETVALEKAVQPGVDQNKAADVKQKALKAMTTSQNAMGRLTQAAESSKLAEKAAQAAFEVTHMITEKVKKAMELLGDLAPQQVKDLLKLAKTSEAEFSHAVSNAASSSSLATESQTSATSVNKHAKQAVHEADEIKKVGDQNTDGVNSVRNKENIKKDAQLAAQHATEALDKAKKAENKAKAAFENANEAVQAFQQILDAAKNAVTAADEVIKQNSKGGAPSFTSQGGSDLSLQQNEQAPPAGDSEAAVVPNGLSSTEPTEATTTSDEHTGETSSPASDAPESPLLPSSSVVSAAMGGSGGTDGSGSAGWMCAPSLLLLLGALIGCSVF